jgi:hypothetical protein
MVQSAPPQNPDKFMLYFEHIKIKVYRFLTTKSISRIKSMLILCPDASSFLEKFSQSQ